ncbi:MAG: hypothetical protein OXC14_20320 [Rhodospirillaceae bacterium]|nr:hypothetical protein [Rhodospirillaceae bacterium]
MTSMLNNRELAALIWVSAVVLWAFSKTSVRESLVGVVKAFVRPQILLPLVALFAWVGLELWVGAQLGIWNRALAKGTILWTLGSAGVLLFNSAQIDSDGDDVHFFRRTVLATVGVAAFVEFFVNLYVMSLPAELIFQIVVALPSLVVAVAGQKPDYKSVKAFCERVLAFVGFAFFALAARQVYLDWHQLDARELALDLALPVWLTVGLVPFLYLFSIYVAYDVIFRRISGEKAGKASRWRSRLALLSVLHFRADTVRKLAPYWYVTRKLGEAQTFSAARGVVAEFLDALSRREQARLDAEERLRRFSGSQGQDDGGRRLDRREFAETTDALHWLATCQMGWHRNGGRYRRDLLRVLGNDFTGHGLPKESGITLHVAQDGQSWYAWRRTVTGWCFAIGAAGPPPDQWTYDGPEPPKGFPGKDSSWGDGPFADRVNRNWG